jgi:hypothetical protein
MFNEKNIAIDVFSNVISTKFSNKTISTFNKISNEYKVRSITFIKHKNIIILEWKS